MWCCCINLGAAVVATVLNAVVGMIWYSPRVFGERWARSLGFDINGMQMNHWHIVAAMVNGFVLACACGLLFKLCGVQSLCHMRKIAAVIFAGVIVTTGFSEVIWARKPMEAYAINMGHWAVSIAVITAVFYFWA